MNLTVDAMYATTDENKFIEVTYANGEGSVVLQRFRQRCLD